MKLYTVYFSPTGGTKKVLDELVRNGSSTMERRMNQEKHPQNWLKLIYPTEPGQALFSHMPLPEERISASLPSPPSADVCLPQRWSG